MFFNAKIKCAQNFNFHQFVTIQFLPPARFKIAAFWEIFTNLQPFNFKLQQDLKIAAFWENPELFLLKFSKNSAKFWRILQHFVKK